MQIARKHAEAYCRQTLGYKASNMHFVKGHIELLDEAGIASESMDLIISNCVINLSPDKGRVLQQAFRVLAPGGEMYFSDVYCNRRVPKSAQEDEVDTLSPKLLLCTTMPNSTMDTPLPVHVRPDYDRRNPHF